MIEACARSTARLLASLACAVFLLSGPAAAQEVSSAAVPEAPPAREPVAPDRVVDRLHATLTSVMQNAETLGYQGRFDRLAPVLDETFDIPFMAQKSVGRHWKEVDPERQQQLVDTFRRFTIANYAGRFDHDSGQSFETLGVEESARGTRIVNTRLHESDTEEVQLNYRLRLRDDRWRIIDVYLNGTVSELALRRSEYSSLIARDGFDALMTALDERILELAAGKSPAEDS